MVTEKTSNKPRTGVWVGALLGLVGLAVVCAVVVWPFWLQISDQAGPFYITFSPADMDGDGDTDVLVHNMRKPARFEAWSGGTLWTNRGGEQGWETGMFTRRVNDIEGGWASTLADLDGDGDPDVLIYHGNRITLGINQGGVQAGEGGVFEPVVELPTPTWDLGQYGVLLAGELNNDGRVDALLLGRAHSYAWEGQPYPDNISWTWLNGVGADGLFKTETATIEALRGWSVAGAALGDLDGDGDLDLAALVSPSAENAMSGSSIVVLLNDGQGNFSERGTRLRAREGSSMALGDLDGDGDLDALVGTGNGTLIYANQGSGDFKATGSSLPREMTRSVNLADMDNDGDLDALVTAGRRARLWWNDGKGQLSQAKQSFPCNARQDVTVADVNGDGCGDIFVGEYDRGAWVWINEGEGSFRRVEADSD